VAVMVAGVPIKNAEDITFVITPQLAMALA
jgi:hypothetical protein